MTLASLLSEAAAKLGQNLSSIDPDGKIFEITLKDNAILTIEELDEKTCSLSALLCFYPAQDDLRDLFETLLEVHSFGIATRGATFAVNRAASKIILFKNIPLESLDPERLLEEMMVFLQTLGACRELQSSGAWRASGEASSSAEVFDTQAIA